MYNYNDSGCIYILFNSNDMPYTMSQLEIDIRFWYTAYKVKLMMFVVKYVPLSPENWGTLMAKSLCGIEYMVWLANMETEVNDV